MNIIISIQLSGLKSLLFDGIRIKLTGISWLLVLELREIHFLPDCEERILIDDDLLDLPCGEESPFLARSLFEDEGWTRRPLDLPVPSLAFLVPLPQRWGIAPLGAR